MIQKRSRLCLKLTVKLVMSLSLPCVTGLGTMRMAVLQGSWKDIMLGIMRGQEKSLLKVQSQLR